MIYADTDYLLALLKPYDWLKEGAKRHRKKYSGRIWTSQATIIELALVCVRDNLDVDAAVEAAFNLVEVDRLTLEEALTATHHICHENMTVFDAFHVALSGDDAILSSDKAYDRIGKARISLDG